jgi:hypothetical protein
MWPKFLAYLKEDPAVFAGFAQAAVAFATQLGLNWTAHQQGALLTAVTGALALLVAVYTRPFKVSALTGFGLALGTALIAFGVPHVTAGAVSSANALVGILAGILVSMRAVPVASLRKAREAPTEPWPAAPPGR